MLRHFPSFSPPRCLPGSKRGPVFVRYGRENLREGKAADLQDRSRYLAYAILATQCVVRSDGIQSAANLAALMAPEDQKSMHLQRLEDSNVRRLWRLINALGKVRQGALEKKDVK